MLQHDLTELVRPPISAAGRDALLRELDDLRAQPDEDGLHGGRIARLEEMLRVAPLAEPGIASIGSHVTVEDSAGKLREFELTSTHDNADAGRGAASAASPVGRAILGNRPGDLVTVELPDGRAYRLRIVSIDEQRAA